MTDTKTRADPFTLDDRVGALASAGRLADAIETYVRETDWVTYAELMRHFAPFVPVEGDCAIWAGRPELNILIWQGISQELVDVLRTLLRGARVHLVPTNVLTYLIDGGMLRLPVAHCPPRSGYKSMHWLPVCIRPGAAICEDDLKLAVNA